ncbi:hypothetical protein INS49_014207 [Diaporthe citri]|uniref:uncharacterized protein n=1 Tax=Diaporthe citri TaxID=83186 RepID=UPI001C802F70|nr:uncharacterized protein INS49_014207 [Diaporthe citri]KAG6358323.1 hypothetical protein INS49_014207 [Diaporthe citri]
MAGQPPFTLSRATEADMPEVIRLCWLSFPQIIRDLLMGCPTEDDLPRSVARYQEEMRADPHALWIKVVDNATGRIAAASHWRIFPGASAPAGADEDTPPPWLDDESRVKAQGILAEMTEARVKANPDGYVHLHILFTDTDFRRQGAGDMMLQWGTDVADVLAVAGWVEASKDGTILYERHGFKVVGYQSSGGTFMRREPNHLAKAGGRVKA